VIGLISYLTVDESGQGVSVSGLARRLGVSKPALYPMLDALLEAGFIVRHPARKTFHLGPAIVAAGQAAAKREPRQELAREAMLRLGEELDLTCWLYSDDGDRLRVVDQAWHAKTPIPIMRVGERYQLVPPVGAVIMAWAGEARVSAWLDRVSPSPQQAQRYRSKLSEIRTNRYVIGLEESSTERIRHLAHELANATQTAERARLVDLLVPPLTIGSDSIVIEPDAEEYYNVKSIDAPIFGVDGRFELGLSVTNLPPMNGRSLRQLAHRVRGVAEEVTKSP
jgi:DNA-binding IclR family transcriptional regulator